MRMRKIVGYIRVSSVDQNEERQYIELKRAGVLDMPLLDTRNGRELQQQRAGVCIWGDRSSLTVLWMPGK